MGDDPLDSFFAEITEIEQSGPIEDGNSDATSSVSNFAAAAVPLPQLQEIVVIEKPQIKTSSHKVYTYDAPEYEEKLLADTSSLSYAYSSASTTTFQPPRPAGAPPLKIVQRDPNKKIVRTGGGEKWVDDTLLEWPDNDYRIFVGDIGKEVTTEMLGKMFQQYKSYAMSKVVRSKVENKGRGYGFVSFLDPMDCAKAIREMNGKYLGTR